MPENQDHLRRIFEELAAGGEPSQRLLAARLGIALGQVNRLLRILLDKGWLHGRRGPGRRVRYVLTVEGERAHARMSREQLDRALASYVTVRDRVRERLGACVQGTAGRAASGVVLYGTGEVAPIVFACAAELGVRLLGFVDDMPRESYLGLPVLDPTHLTSMSLNGHAFQWLFVATLTDQEAVRARLVDIGFPLEHVRWL
ncbi:MAG TPA: winged helix-turn-helix transcriptional regulator [Vicinamibacterales bacterium]|nr:winged helix-turn-helix transcriptional regulator [Vicinamibacterales bacterium]